MKRTEVRLDVESIWRNHRRRRTDVENRRNVKKRVKSEVRCVEAYFYSLMTECHKGIIIFLAITAEFKWEVSRSFRKEDNNTFLPTSQGSDVGPYKITCDLKSGMTIMKWKKEEKKKPMHKIVVTQHLLNCLCVLLDCLMFFCGKARPI